jgi:hypothetical protein
MCKAAIETFLDLPGVEGVGLFQRQANRQSPHQLNLYLYWKEQIQTDQKKKQLIEQLVSEALKTLPEQLNFSEFKLANYFTYLYSLADHTHLLVLARIDLVAIKLLAARQLKVHLQKDISQAIVAFQELSGKFSPFQLSTTPERAQPTSKSLAVNPAMVSASPTTIEDLLKTLNSFSQRSKKYLGGTLTVNYLKSCRPDFEWLKKFQIHNADQITYEGELTEAISDLQVEWFQAWMNRFVERCAQIIKDFSLL